MRGRDRRGNIADAVADHQRGQQKTFGTGGASAVKPDIRNVKGLQSVCRTDTLVEQVSCKKCADILGFHFGFGKGGVERHALHFALCLLPCFHAKTVAWVAEIKELAKRTVCLFSPHNTCKGENFGRRFDYVFSHIRSPPGKIFCADFALLYQAVRSIGKVREKCENYFRFLQKNREKFIDNYIIICYTYTWIFSGA